MLLAPLCIQSRLESSGLSRQGWSGVDIPMIGMSTQSGGPPRSKSGGLTAHIPKTAKMSHCDILGLHAAQNSKTHKTAKTHGRLLLR